MRHAFYILVIILAATTAAQDQQTRTFVKILHTTNETIAVDSAGREWIYDAAQARFVPIDEARDSTAEPSDQTNDDYDVDGVILPPEIRCTNIHKGDIVELFSEVTVDVDERVEGLVVSGRDVTVLGLVVGDVVSYRTVHIARTGEIRGDVVAEDLERERGGRLLGEWHRVSFPQAVGFGAPIVSRSLPDALAVFLIAFQVFLCLIVIAIVPKQLQRIITKIESGAVKAFFWGLLGWFSVLPIFALLLITIVGIPIAVLIYPLVFVAAVILAYVSVSVFIGSIVSKLFGWHDRSIYIRGIVGVVALAAVRLLADILTTIGLGALGAILGVLYIIVMAVALTVGFGAVLSARFGMEPKRARLTVHMGPAPAVKPPPPPQVNPSQTFGPEPPPLPIPPPRPDLGDATGGGEIPSNK